MRNHKRITLELYIREEEIRDPEILEEYKTYLISFMEFTEFIRTYDIKIEECD